MNYENLIRYENKKTLLCNPIWDSRKYFILDEASRIIKKSDLIVALFSNRIIFIYNLDLLQLRYGILIGHDNRYSIQEYISDIRIKETSLIWYNNSVHLCLVYSD